VLQAPGRAAAARPGIPGRSASERKVTMTTERSGGSASAPLCDTARTSPRGTLAAHRAAVQDHHPVAEAAPAALSVAHEEARASFGAHGVQCRLTHRSRKLGIADGQRLVHQEHGRVARRATVKASRIRMPVESDSRRRPRDARAPPRRGSRASGP
jgi:hypothetical protein